MRKCHHYECGLTMYYNVNWEVNVQCIIHTVPLITDLQCGLWCTACTVHVQSLYSNISKVNTRVVKTSEFLHTLIWKIALDTHVLLYRSFPSYWKPGLSNVKLYRAYKLLPVHAKLQPSFTKQITEIWYVWSQREGFIA